MKATLVNNKPLHPDELTLDGQTFEATVDFQFTKDDGTIGVEPRLVSVFVPTSVKNRNDKEVGVSQDVLLFFAANEVHGDGWNELLIHGLRASAQRTTFVVIAIPSPGDHPDPKKPKEKDTVPFDRPDFCCIDEPDIKKLLDAVGLNDSIGTMRLASHSRGHQGMTRTLMGNDQIGETAPHEHQRDPFTADILAPFIDITKIERLIYLDNFYGSSERIFRHLVFKGVSKKALGVYQVTAGNYIQDTSIVADMKRQFVPIAAPSKTIFDKEVVPTVDHQRIAALGCLRFIKSALAVEAAQGKDMPVTKKLFDDLNVLQLYVGSHLPLRGNFSTHQPTPPNATDYVTFFKNSLFSSNPSSKATPVASQTKKLLDFLNSADLLRTAPDRYEFRPTVAAHHFFVCEIAQELFE